MADREELDAFAHHLAEVPRITRTSEQFGARDDQRPDGRATPDGAR